MKTCRFGGVFGSRGGSGQRLVVCSNQPIRADCSSWRVDGLNRRRAGASLPCSQRVFRDGCEKVKQKARCIDRSPLSRLRPTSAAAAPLYLVCPRPEARSPKVKARRHASPCRAPAGRASRPRARRQNRRHVRSARLRGSASCAEVPPLPTSALPASAAPARCAAARAAKSTTSSRAARA